MDWLFEIGAGVSDLMTRRLVDLPGLFLVGFFLEMGAIYRRSRMRGAAVLFSFLRFFMCTNQFLRFLTTILPT